MVELNDKENKVAVFVDNFLKEFNKGKNENEKLQLQGLHFEYELLVKLDWAFSIPGNNVVVFGERDQNKTNLCIIAGLLKNFKIIDFQAMKNT